MAYISKSKMPLTKITKKTNYLKRILFARNFQKIPGKFQKIQKKFPQDRKVPQIANKSHKYSNK